MHKIKICFNFLILFMRNSMAFFVFNYGMKLLILKQLLHKWNEFWTNCQLLVTQKMLLLKYTLIYSCFYFIFLLAIVNTEDGQEERYFVPGWMYQHINIPRVKFLTTTQGIGLCVGDLINFYVDPKMEAKPYTAVACNVDVLKHVVESPRYGYWSFILTWAKIHHKDESTYYIAPWVS